MKLINSSQKKHDNSQKMKSISSQLMRNYLRAKQSHDVEVPRVNAIKVVEMKGPGISKSVEHRVQQRKLLGLLESN